MRDMELNSISFVVVYVAQSRERWSGRVRDVGSNPPTSKIRASIF